MMTAPTSVEDLLATRPQKAVIANLFTFTLLSGPVYTLTDWRRPLVVSGTTFAAGPPRVQRGSIAVERGMKVATQKVTFQEANGAFIAKLAGGYFNRALYTMQRVFAADQRLIWTLPMTRCAGRVNSIDSITRSSAEITVKSMIDDLDHDYPRDVVEPDCNRVVFDEGCGLSAAAYLVNGTVAAGSTKNTLRSGLTNPDTYFTQGVVTFTSGVLSGLAYMVKQYTGGVVTPSYPFLAAPTAGDTFTITPGCDNTLATCIAKYGYNAGSTSAPFFRGTPFVPDPTVTY
ncbi:MAG: DUF2163 domain-containing protein [Acidobacteriota bacterium]|nr:DUF2163 domain-containing protein [Acidobacteriota bacterium]